MENVPYFAGKDGCYMQSAISLFVKSRSKSPGLRHDVARKFWASVIPARLNNPVILRIQNNRTVDMKLLPPILQLPMY